MLINISSDQIIISWSDYRQLIPYQDLERHLPVLLASYITTYRPAEIIVLNGPGSFTTLRIGCLTINVLKKYGKHPFVLYDISKIDLYKAAYTAGILAEKIAIYLGQQKQCRLLNLTTGTTEKIPYAAAVSDDSMIDEIIERERFFGEQCLQATQQSITLSRDGENICIHSLHQTGKLSLKQLWCTPHNALAANYELAPTLGVCAA